MHPVLPVVPKVLSSHLVLLLLVLLKHQECLLVPRVPSPDKLLKDLVLQAFLRAQDQDLHLMDLEVPSNLVLLHNHLHHKDPELFRHHLVLKDLVPQAFPRAQEQSLSSERAKVHVRPRPSMQGDARRQKSSPFETERDWKM